MAEHNIALIIYGDNAYPTRLAMIADPPAMLYVKGDRHVLCEPQIAMVGSRNASADGMALAGAFATELASIGITVTSGMALGIDAQAHSRAIAAGGTTCAVLGTGVDVIYPLRHQALARHIETQGVLVSEHLPGVPPRPGHFPARNRTDRASVFHVEYNNGQIVIHTK